MSNRYRVVNPVIGGTFNTDYNSTDPDKAAQEFWFDFSKHINGNVPKFYFTLKDLDSGEYHSYCVKEKPDGRKDAILTITKVDTNIPEEVKRAIDEDISKTNKLVEQFGGAYDQYHDTDDEDYDDENYDDEQVGGRRRRDKEYTKVKKYSKSNILESDYENQLLNNDMSLYNDRYLTDSPILFSRDLGRTRYFLDDSSSSSSFNSDSFDSDDDDIELNNYLRRMKMLRAINYMAYRPYNYGNTKTIFIPSFKPELTPYIQLKLDTPFFIRR